MIFSPSLFTGKSLHVYVHELSSFNVTAAPSAVPSANNWTSIASGLIPSWSSASSHAFVTVIVVTPGVCLFVTVYPSSWLPVTSWVYPVGTDVSSTV